MWFPFEIFDLKKNICLTGKNKLGNQKSGKHTSKLKSKQHGMYILFNPWFSLKYSSSTNASIIFRQNTKVNFTSVCFPFSTWTLREVKSKLKRKGGCTKRAGNFGTQRKITSDHSNAWLDSKSFCLRGKNKWLLVIMQTVSRRTAEMSNRTKLLHELADKTKRGTSTSKIVKEVFDPICD